MLETLKTKDTSYENYLTCHKEIIYNLLLIVSYVDCLNSFSSEDVFRSDSIKKVTGLTTVVNGHRISRSVIHAFSVCAYTFILACFCVVSS